MSGPLPSVTAMKKALLTAVAAVAWFLPGHLVILALLVFFWGTAMASTANTAKTRSVEDRLAAHVTATAPAVSFVASGGTVGGNVTVTGSHTVQGNFNAHNGISYNNGIVGDTISTSSDVTIGGNGTTNGSHTVQGNFNAHNGISYNNGITGDTMNISGYSRDQRHQRGGFRQHHQPSGQQQPDVHPLHR